jgi:ferrous iron transport protein B
MNLAELKPGDVAAIMKVRGRGAFRKRILEMGFVAGKEVTVIKEAPLGDPVEYMIMGYNVSLRKSEARMIDVEPCDSDRRVCSYEGVIDSDQQKTGTRSADKVINVALVGNPNCGKTTIFNNASDSRERVGNYSGVTVEAKEASFDHRDYLINITDLPGTYSITAYTPEELYVRSFILEKMPDVVINVIDGSNIERNLYLTTQLIDMDIKVIIALNMYDELQKKGDQFDFGALGLMIGIPIIPTVGSKGTGIIELFDKVIEVYEDRDQSVRHIHINYGTELEQSINAVQASIKCIDNFQLTDLISSRFLAIKLLEKDKDSRDRISVCRNAQEILSIAEHERGRIEKIFGDDCETVITDAKYGFINGALKETVVPNVQTNRKTSEIIDTILTNRILGFPVFLIIMWLIFQITFSIGKFPMELISKGVGLVSDLVSTFMPDGSLKALLIDGVIGGVGGVIVFLPNILILFFFISLMEDTGYMARAAFIMDRVMHRIGLHGKSFIPLIMGFGCNVPAIMATRTIESKSDRLVTILISPFMSCSARLPVYVLFISAFFPDRAGSMLFLIYAIGVAIAAFSAILFKKTFFRDKDIPFVMELPPYRIPTLRSAGKHMWDKGVQYLKKMGGVILLASIIIWALGHYPQKVEFSKDYNAMTMAINQQVDDDKAQVNPLLDPARIAEIEKIRSERIAEIERMKRSEHQEKSYIGRLGHLVEPVLSPLGFDWRIGISIMTGLAAKEIVVSSMGVLFNADSTDGEGGAALGERLKTQVVTSGARKGEFLFTPLVAFSFILFVLIYFPCIATITAIRNETGSYKWPIFSMMYSTGMAWVVSFVVYQVGRLIL